MRTLVVYDIGDNLTREEFARKLKQLGLERIQRSCFLGRGGIELAKTVVRIAERTVNARRDVVHVFLLDEYSFRSMRCVGRPLNWGRTEGVEFVGGYGT
ncbi:MAG: CRISPR-associated endonuclease Cas2 [Sulfolobales archaeon]|nr:CRISPR-associated endonuclease Cas2 [Sulfolobales archaeon]MCX8208477.1 CRISPR-associated endonuclease Cas2 [Sulfolobales archaeon]MDW8010999.1 CRISPR-associated endonuclease Cas2 [Sulfolobales archaeon]